MLDVTTSALMRMRATPLDAPTGGYRSLLYDKTSGVEIPRISHFEQTVRISDAHPSVLREFVFFDDWSQSEQMFRLGLGYAFPVSADEPRAQELRVRLGNDFPRRASETLGHFHLSAPLVPAGLAVLMDEKIHLGAPIHVHDTVFFRVMYPRSRNYGLAGIPRKNVRGARIIQTEPDAKHGTFSVQFWETVTASSPTAAAPRVHLIYGLDRDDAQEWCRLLQPAPDKRLPLPEWAGTRGSLEKCHVSTRWQIASVAASVIVPASCLLPMLWNPTPLASAPLLMPFAMYGLWRTIYQIPVRNSRAWFASALGSARAVTM